MRRISAGIFLVPAVLSGMAGALLTSSCSKSSSTGLYEGGLEISGIVYDSSTRKGVRGMRVIFSSAPGEYEAVGQEEVRDTVYSVDDGSYSLKTRVLSGDFRYCLEVEDVDGPINRSYEGNSAELFIGFSGKAYDRKENVYRMKGQNIGVEQVG